MQEFQIFHCLYILYQLDCANLKKKNLILLSIRSSNSKMFYPQKKSCIFPSLSPCCCYRSIVGKMMWICLIWLLAPSTDVLTSFKLLFPFPTIHNNTMTRTIFQGNIATCDLQETPCAIRLCLYLLHFFGYEPNALAIPQKKLKGRKRK